MRSLLLILFAASSGCASVRVEAPSRVDVEGQTLLMANAGSVRTTGSRTQRVGLPLGRGGKIGLWTGVAVLLAYLMATDGEDGEAGTADP